MLTTTWSQLWPAGGLLMVAALLFVLGERSTDRPSVAEPRPTSLATRVDIPALLLTVAAAVPLIWFAAEMVASARAGRYPNDDITVGLNHWPMQAALPLAMLADAGLTAVRQSGWQVSAWTVVAGTAWMGVFSVAYPHHAGSFGLLGGAGAILWSALFAAATRRSSRQAHPPEE